MQNPYTINYHLIHKFYVSKKNFLHHDIITLFSIFHIKESNNLTIVLPPHHKIKIAKNSKHSNKKGNSSATQQFYRN